MHHRTPPLYAVTHITHYNKTTKSNLCRQARRGSMDAETLANAKQIRKAFEEVELRRLPKIRNVTLKGYCARASYELYRWLQSADRVGDFVLGTYNGYSHCWVEIDHEIIDLTATQFCIMDAVYVTSVSNPKYKKQCTNEDALLLVQSTWPEEQRVI